MPNIGVQQFTQMVRMGDGTYVPATDIRNAKPSKPQKFLIVIQYYEGDKDAAEDLGSLIADLERVRNHEADVLIFRRFDASEFSRSVRTKLEGKFDKVYFETSRRKDARGYPFAANQMWSDLVTLVAQYNPWSTEYYAFIPLEADCVPVHPGWIRELIEEFRVAKFQGLSAVGHVHHNPVEHLNGVAVYDIHIWQIVGGGKLNGGDPQVAYDIYQGPNIIPHAKDTSAIVFDYQRPTIIADDLFQKWKDGIEPALFHGVKDASARECVRARHITFSDHAAISGATVFTYVHHKTTLPLPVVTQAAVTLWADGWRSRGWNPVVLRLRDAVKNPRYHGVLAALAKFPYSGDRERLEAEMLRWVALDSMGGGLLVESDALPGNFIPRDIPSNPTIFNSKEVSPQVVAGYMDRTDLAKFLEQIIGHDAQPDDMVEGRPHVSDRSIIERTGETQLVVDPKVVRCGEPGWRDAAIISFAPIHIMRFGVRGTPLAVMDQYLRGA